ncbi:MAG: site-specific integrase [Pseudomonadota bacterium]
MANKPKLPKGVTRRGDKYRASVMVMGERYTGTFETVDAAHRFALDAREGLLPDQRKAGEEWTIEEAEEAYRIEVSIPNSATETTIKTNQDIARRLLEFFGKERILSTITDNEVIEWRTSMFAAGLAASTVNLRMSRLRSLLNYAQKREKISGRPANVERVKVKATRIRYLTVAEERAVLHWFSHHGFENMEDLVAFLVDTGLRVNVEALRLKWRDVDLASQTVHIWEGKSAHPRAVPLTSRAFEILRRRKLKHGQDKGPFTRLGYRTVNRHWTKMRDSLGFSQDAAFVVHVLRHTCCTRLVSGGTDLRSVQKWMGHSNINTTMRYAQFVPGNMIGAVAVLEKASAPDLKVISGDRE